MTPGKLLDELAKQICSIARPHPLRVAIDGVDAAGKTRLADGLVPFIEACNRSVIRASVDGFHNPRALRYRLGAASPEGYYRDSFDHTAILRELLIPLGPGGNRRYRRSVFDYREDAPTQEPEQEAPLNAVLLFDGVFLLRPELIQSWDFSIFLEVDFSVSVPRAVQRDILTSGGEANPRRLQYECRYVPGQQLYFAEAHPRENASIIVDNNDFQNPIILSS
jgi:uridine kinase